jgi:hypothetical protein
MTKIDLSIIIVDYKSKKFTLECLKSINENLKDITFEIIVVDNNQAPEFRIQNSELSKILAPSAFCLLPSANQGFGAANNLGVKKASGEYLLLLNPDTLVFDDSIQKMLGFIKNHKEIGALTCLLGPDKKKLQKDFFGKFQSLGSITIRRYYYNKLDQTGEFFYTGIVTGAALMIKKELFDKIGGFDERFFMYLEDDDLCKRLIDLGYKNAVLNTAKIIHLEGKSITKNSDRKRIYYRSQDLYWQKHNGFLPTLLMRIIRFPYKMIKTNK